MARQKFRAIVSHKEHHQISDAEQGARFREQVDIALSEGWEIINSGEVSTGTDIHSWVHLVKTE